MQVYKCANVDGLLSETALVWWLTSFLFQSRMIIYKFKSQYWKQTHKCGNSFSKSVEESVQIEK